MGSGWRGKTEESCKLVVNNIYLWKMLFLLQNALSFQAPSFAMDFNAQLGQMSSIQIPHPDPNSLARLLGHKPAKKLPEILWSLYSVERLRFQKKLLTLESNRQGWRGLRWGWKFRPRSFVSALTAATPTTQALAAVIGLLDMCATAT